jgi:hypothetical protein
VMQGVSTQESRMMSPNSGWVWVCCRVHAVLDYPGWETQGTGQSSSSHTRKTPASLEESSHYTPSHQGSTDSSFFFLSFLFIYLFFCSYFFTFPDCIVFLCNNYIVFSCIIISYIFIPYSSPPPLPIFLLLFPNPSFYYLIFNTYAFNNF